MKIDNWGPIPIFWADNPKHKEYKDKIVQFCLNVKSNNKEDKKDWVAQRVFSSLNLHNLYQDLNYDPLNIWIDSQVEKFKELVDIKEDVLQCENAWFNIYEMYDYQEFHQHKGHDLSCVYFLKSEEDGPKLVFENNNNLFSLTSGFDNFAPRYFYESIEGRLIIFPSELRHCVEQNLTNTQRITLAYNYNGSFNSR